MTKKIFLLAFSLLAFNTACVKNESIDFQAIDLQEESVAQSVSKAVETTPEDTYQALLKKTYVLIDVREKNEYDAVHIKDIKLIPLGTLAQEIGKLDKKVKYITICRSGRRSLAAADEMEKAGLSVFSMKGGMISWEEKKLPVVKPSVKK